MARRVPLVGLAVGFLVAFFVFSQKGHPHGGDEDIFQKVPLVYAPIYIEAADYWKRFTTHTNKRGLEKGT